MSPSDVRFLQILMIINLGQGQALRPLETIATARLVVNISKSICVPASSLFLWTLSTADKRHHTQHTCVCSWLYS